MSLSPPLQDSRCTAIRPWSEPDRGRLHDVLRQMHGESRYAFLAYDHDKMEAWISGYLAESPHRCAILASDEHGEIAGVLAGYLAEYFFCPDLVARDQVIYTLPRFRGSWVATRLIRSFVRFARDRGAREVVLSTTTDVQPQRTGAFFDALGFRQIGGQFAARL